MPQPGGNRLDIPRHAEQFGRSGASKVLEELGPRLQSGSNENALKLWGLAPLESIAAALALWIATGKLPGFPSGAPASGKPAAPTELPPTSPPDSGAATVPASNPPG